MTLELSDRASMDLVGIWLYNAERYDVDHADRYNSYLNAQMRRLIEAPLIGVQVEGYPTLRRMIMLRSSGGHGHTAYYRVTAGAILIVRVLHTAMEAPKHLGR